jgi:hypothetical protein
MSGLEEDDKEEVVMTEAEWLRSFNSQKMMAVARDKGSERLWRLFLVACARQIEDRMRDVRSPNALAVAERFADGKATRKELRAARELAEAAAHQAHLDEWEDEARANFRVDEQYKAVCEAVWPADAALPCVAEHLDINQIPARLPLPDMLREIFGNPFRWKVVDPIWLA